MIHFYYFFFNDTATTEIYTYLHTLSLHDALPISLAAAAGMDLRLHYRERPGKLLCGCNSLFDAHRGNAPGDGNAKFREQFFRLIFVDVHELSRAFRLWKREICGAA